MTNEEVGGAVAEKRIRAFEEWLQRRDKITYMTDTEHREWL